MPAKPLTPEQLRDAQRLMAIFEEHKTKHGLTQAMLADELGYSVQSSVSQYLKGKIPLNVEAAVKFAGRFGCAVSEFSPSIQKEIDRIAGFSEKHNKNNEINSELSEISDAYINANEEERELVRAILFARTGYSPAWLKQNIIMSNSLLGLIHEAREHIANLRKNKRSA